MVGGNASGKDEAEKNVMASEGVGGSIRGGKRILVARSVFSGMYRNEGMLYLTCVLENNDKMQAAALTSHVYVQPCSYSPN